MIVVFSYLSLFVVFTVLFDSVVHAAFSFRPPKSTCVWTERQLRKVIEKATNETRTRVTLCRQTISISNSTDDYGRTGIDLTDRFVDIRCYLKRSKGSCVLDGGQESRIFLGDRADVSVKNVVFINAKPISCSSGGAIRLYSSNLTLTGCSFMNNGNCEYGGAITVSDSMLTINGGSKKRPVRFSDNGGDYGGAIYVYESKASINGYTVFANNSGIWAGAVKVYYSIFDFKNVKFQENFAGSTENFGSTISALSSDSSQVNMTNVDFIGNKGNVPVNRYLSSSLFATNCTFANNNGTVFEAKSSKITLKNSTFSNNTSNEDASNIFITDDFDPFEDGTFVKCESDVVFCNGISKDSLYEVSNDDSLFGYFNNTDCYTKGLQGTPGQGSCPI